METKTEGPLWELLEEAGVGSVYRKTWKAVINGQVILRVTHYDYHTEGPAMSESMISLGPPEDEHVNQWRSEDTD